MLQQDKDRQNIFVGRESQQEQYQRFLRGEETYWILFCTGIPGIGKTRLLCQLKEQTPDDVSIIDINFQNTYPYPHLLTDPLQVLEALAVSANSFCDEERYHEFMTILQKERKQIKEFEEQLNKEIERLRLQISEPAKLAQIKKEVLSAEQKIHQRVRGTVTSAFYDQIDTLKTKQLVLMLDTCERLLEPGGRWVGQWLMGELLPKLHDRMEQLNRRCLVVIGSRVSLASAVIQRRDREHFELELLTKEEVNEYLDKAGIGNEVNEYLDKAGIGTKVDDSTSWKERIYEITHGHPLSLSIIRELWDEKDKKPSSDEDGDIAAFQSKFEEKVSTDFVEERILKRLPSPFRELTEYGVLLRSFSLPELQSLFPDLLPELEARDKFNEFIRYPYIESQGGYRYTFHEFVREALAKHTQEKHPKEWQDYNKAALDLFTPGVGVPKGASRSPEWYYHFIASNEMEGMKAWKEAIEQARTSGRNNDIGSLLQVAGDSALNLTPASQVILLEEQEIEYLIEKAKELRAEGDEQRQYGDLDAALESYKEALKLFQEVGNSREDEAGLLEVIDEIEQLLKARSAATKKKATTNRGILQFPITLIRKRPLLAAGISLLVIVLVFVLILVSILHGGIPNLFPRQLASGIGVTQLSNGELIGISNGIFAFDANCRTANSLKCQAASRLRQGDIDGAESLWNRALAANTNDAEMLIYLEDQRVQSSPHVTLVVATTLTGSAVNVGRDNLQGAYIAQKEFNDGFKLPNGLKVSLLIANFGSDPTNATMVAKQIVQAAQADKTIVGVMGLPLSSYVPAAMAILQQAHLPLVSSGASSDALSGSSPFFFRIVPSDESQARVGVDYAIHTLHAHIVALFYDPKDSSSNGLAKDFERDFTGSGGIVREKTYTTGQSETLRLQLKDILKNPPDLLYFAGSATDMNTVLIHLPPSSNLRIMGSDSLYQMQSYLTAPHPSLIQLYFTAFAYPDEWNVLCHNGLLQACSKPSFFTVYPQAFDDGKHQKQPYGYTRANSSTIVSYDALSVLLTAYQRTISPGKDLQGALKTITGSRAFQGVSGQISFSGNGNPLNKVVVILSVDPHGDVRLASSNGIQGCFLINQCRNP